ncbi:dTDP-4-dehydrorhamnose reductase [Desulfonema ishimotonii]|uniref:dTDP-4-dehydrorhamnose reductase n=1 Tax=Desulfonema ishimotonii TaxID=45657 RepID=A0A401G4C1_9BACT|nr:dTDP-4-dehydrorhamnose reductase [Desulfonema ishimotonii]GBC64041.1 dTDP-4-dehydrorhamnose reductase [Desulfonema ishimotonii]
MNLLITGAGGQLGHELVRQCQEKGIGFSAPDRRMLDITDPAQVESALTALMPSLVINGAAYTQVDRAETDAETAFAVNRDGAACLAEACAGYAIPLIHVSTDFVFDGQTDRPWRETDPVRPINIYGKSKAAGEAAIRSCLDRHIIVRTAWLYGSDGHNFVTTMLRLARERDCLRVVADQFGCPTAVTDLAEALLILAARIRVGGEIPWGICHYCGGGITSWHGFADEIIRQARHYAPLRTRHVCPITTGEYPTPARRPSFSALDCSRIENTFGIRPKPWRQRLTQVIQKIMQPKNHHRD